MKAVNTLNRYKIILGINTQAIKTPDYLFTCLNFQISVQEISKKMFRVSLTWETKRGFTPYNLVQRPSVTEDNMGYHVLSLKTSISCHILLIKSNISKSNFQLDQNINFISIHCIQILFHPDAFQVTAAKTHNCSGYFPAI